MINIRKLVLPIVGALLILFSLGAYADILNVPAQSAVADTPQGIRLINADRELASWYVKIWDASTLAGLSPLNQIITSGPVEGIAFTPDGTKAYVAVAGSDPHVGVINFESGEPTAFWATIDLPLAASPRHIAVSARGDYAFLVDEALQVVYYFDVTVHPVSVTLYSFAVGEASLCGVAVKPDGTRVAVSRRAAPGYVYIYDISDIPGTTPSLVKTLGTAGGGGPGRRMGYLEKPTYLYYGESDDENSEATYLYIKVATPESGADVWAYDSANDLYPAGIINGRQGINLVNLFGVTKDFVADPVYGNNGLALSANRLKGYVSIYDGSDSLNKIYRFDGDKANLNATFAHDTSSTFIAAIDSIAGWPYGEAVFYANSRNGANASGFDGAITGFNNNIPSAPVITYPLKGMADVTSLQSISWEASETLDGGNITYQIQYIAAADIQSNSWQALANGVSDTTYPLEELGDLAGDGTYYLRVRAIRATPLVIGDGVPGPWVYEGPFDFTIENEYSIIIDDFEGTTVDQVIDPISGSGYNDVNGGVGTKTLVTDGSNYVMEIDPTDTFSDGDGWKGTLKDDVTPMFIDPATFDVIMWEVKGDGSSIKYKMQLVDSNDQVWELPSTLALFSTDWVTVEVSMANMYVVENDQSIAFDGNINGYRLVYNSAEPVGTLQYDNIRAVDTSSPDVPGPEVDLKALFEGFYNDADGNSVWEQRDAYVEIEVRETDTTTVTGVYSNVALDSAGFVNKKLSYLPDGDYYLVIRQVIAGAPYGANHLPVMSATSVNLADTGFATDVNFADPVSPGFMDAYITIPSDPVKTEDDGMHVFRGGDAEGSSSIGSDDYSELSASYGTMAGMPNWNVAADFDGNGAIGSDDYSILSENYGKLSIIP